MGVFEWEGVERGGGDQDANHLNGGAVTPTFVLWD